MPATLATSKVTDCMAAVPMEWVLVQAAASMVTHHMVHTARADLAVVDIMVPASSSKASSSSSRANRVSKANSSNVVVGAETTISGVVAVKGTGSDNNAQVPSMGEMMGLRPGKNFT